MTAVGEKDQWRKVYENRADGTAFSGDIDDLVDAIEAGADVKVRYFFSSFPIQGQWTRTCSSVTFAEDEDSGSAGPRVVSCMVTDIPDTQVDLSQGRRFETPPAVEWQAFNTTGQRQTLEFDQQTGQLVSDTTTNLQMAWFVRS
jgi:hypothetical protein